MKKNIFAAVVAAMSIGAFGASAQAGEFYTGGGLGLYNIAPTTTIGTKSGTAFGAFGTVGMKVHEMASVEARLATTAKTNTSATTGLTLDTSLDYALSLLIKPHYEVADGIDAYALVGATSYQITVASAFGQSSKTNTTLSYGAGVDASLNDMMRVGVEWFRPVTSSNSTVGAFTVDAFTVNASYKF